MTTKNLLNGNGNGNGSGNGNRGRSDLDIEGLRVEALERDWSARLHSWRMQEDEDYFLIHQAAREHYEDHVPYEKWPRRK